MKLKHNIKGLTQDLIEKLDLRMAELRENTVLEGVRPSDAKTFTLIARQTRSISALAKAMQISRQAAHKSVSRLVGHGVITLENKENNQRDKIPTITPKGHKIRQISAQNLKIIEDELTQKIGTKKLETLRALMVELLE